MNSSVLASLGARSATRRVRLARNRNEVQFSRYRAWQWIKHLALADYVWPWANKVGLHAPTIYVVDLFAGAGTYVDVLTGDRADGSPVIFARTALRYRSARPGSQLKVICVERNGKNAKTLRERVKGFGDIVTVLRGSFARHLDTIVSTIGAAPALILFDPIGLKPIAAETIRPLLHRTGKTDVFMVLHFKVLHRTAGMLLPTGHADPSKPGAVERALVPHCLVTLVHPRSEARDAGRRVRYLHRIGVSRALGGPKIARQKGVVVDGALGLVREDSDGNG